jgi:hypothetical protein
MPEILATGLFQQTIKYCNHELMDVQLLRLAYLEILDIVKQYNIEAVGFERFMGRPDKPTFGAWVERLTMLLGVIYHNSDLPVFAIQPSAWKTKLLRRYEIASTKTFFKDFVKTEHEGDALGIALYVHEQKLRKEAPKVRKSKTPTTQVAV